MLTAENNVIEVKLKELNFNMEVINRYVIPITEIHRKDIFHDNNEDRRDQK